MKDVPGWEVSDILSGQMTEGASMLTTWSSGVVPSCGSVRCDGVRDRLARAYTTTPATGLRRRSWLFDGSWLSLYHWMRNRNERLMRCSGFCACGRVMSIRRGGRRQKRDMLSGGRARMDRVWRWYGPGIADESLRRRPPSALRLRRRSRCQARWAGPRVSRRHRRTPGARGPTCPKGAHHRRSRRGSRLGSGSLGQARAVRDGGTWVSRPLRSRVSRPSALTRQRGQPAPAPDACRGLTNASSRQTRQPAARAL